MCNNYTGPWGTGAPTSKEEAIALSARERIEDAGYDSVILLDNFSYDAALIGVTHDDRAVYDFEKMVVWLMDTEGWSWEESVEWIEYNTLRALPYAGPHGPIVIYPV